MGQGEVGMPPPPSMSSSSKLSSAIAPLTAKDGETKHKADGTRLKVFSTRDTVATSVNTPPVHVGEGERPPRSTVVPARRERTHVRRTFARRLQP